MTISLKKILLAVMVLCGVSAMAAVDELTPKLEMRSAWVATVWRLDWPQSTTTGSESSINNQKAEMTRLLDSLAVNNFNAVNFQVRGMSDAMYKSSYEPWSEYLTGTRGKDPGWDPLAFAVEECHKRGMECHAWVNPYRFNSSSTSGGQSGDVTGYIEKGWTITGGSGLILNPGLAEVQDRIVDICKEIVLNYDVDGMLFDDYYYNSAALSEDSGIYNAYVAAGGTLSQADWRRKNVTDLMRKLYNMFESTKPWIRFGQAPQGTTYTSQSMADKYGIEKCPVGYDNNYGSQYIDIMEWFDNGLIDYISPQVYWTIGAENDYSKIVPWWGKVVKKFGRHLFVSHSISSLTSSSDVSYASASAPGLGTETELPTSAMVDTDVNHDDILEASGPNNSTFAEFANEIKINRNSSLNGSCGSIFYSAKYLYTLGTKPSFAHFLKRHVFSHPALLPAMTWKSGATDPGAISNFVYDEEGTLTWDALTNMRYTVYAVPNGMLPEAFDKGIDYLMGVAYGTSFTVPEKYRSGYYFAVCPYDRYANEWTPTFWKPNYSETLAAPALTSPATGFVTNEDFTFKWNAVDGAERYVVDFSTDADFAKIEKSAQTTACELPLADVYSYISKNTNVYWRVHSSAKGKNDGVSESRWFKFTLVAVTSPENGATDLDPKVSFAWSQSVPGEEATLEVSTDEEFSTIVLSQTNRQGSYQAKVYELHPVTNYYARVVVNGRASNYVSFRTKAMPCEVPTFKTPQNNGTCYSNDRIEINPQDGAEFVIIQVDKTDSFGSSKAQKQLSDFATGVDASEIKISRKNPMVDGVTYYARAMAKYYDDGLVLRETDWSDVITFVYSSQESGIDDVSADAGSIAIVGNELLIALPTAKPVAVSATTMLGTTKQLYAASVAQAAVSLSELPAGMYVISVKVGGETRALKFVKH